MDRQNFPDLLFLQPIVDISMYGGGWPEIAVNMVSCSASTRSWRSAGNGNEETLQFAS
jgi:hypothetical protein